MAGLRLLLFLTLFVSQVLLKETTTIAVNLNTERVELQCRFLLQDAEKMRWSNVVAGEKRSVYDHQLKDLNPHYQQNCSLKGQFCTLVVLAATYLTAGWYEFKVGRGGEKWIKACTFELVVGDLECFSNISPMIAASDCYGLEASTLVRSCRFVFNRNSSFERFNITWRRVNGGVEDFKDIESTIEREINEIYKTLELNEKIPVTLTMNKVKSECYLKEYPDISPCGLREMSVGYLKNITAKIGSVKVNSIQKCLLNNNSTLKCEYYWIHEEGRVETKHKSQELNLTRNSPLGNYTCIANCRLGGIHTCSITGGTVEVIAGDDEECEQTSSNVTTIGYIISVLVSVLSTLIVLKLPWRRIINYFQPTEERNRMIG